MITRRQVGNEAEEEKEYPLTPRKPLPDACNTAINESAGHIIEAEAILEKLGSVIPATSSAEYFEVLYHLEASLRWQMYAGAKIVPSVQ